MTQELKKSSSTTSSCNKNLHQDNTSNVTITFDKEGGYEINDPTSISDGTYTISLPDYAIDTDYATDTGSIGSFNTNSQYIWATSDNYISEGMNTEWINTSLVETNPTCKALWDQFYYVYTMIKADHDNEEENNVTSF